MAEQSTPGWGIEPVPQRLRVLGLLDNTLLWGNLGISLLVLVAGTYLVPGLSLRDALLAIVVGGLIGNGMLGLAGLIGAQARVPGMVLLRAPLGRRGSYLATGLNVAQNLGWATFELIVIATAASALSQRAFGWSGRWFWALIFGGVTTAFALLGPISFVRRWVRRVAVWAVLASLAYLVWWTLDGADLGALWSRRGEGGIGFWQGVDLVVAMPVSWLPLVADYTRFSRDRRGAFLGSSLGYLVPHVTLYALGALLLLSRGLSDAAAVVPAIAAGGFASAVALLALTVDETDEPFANVYSTAVSLQNVLPHVEQRVLIVVASALATAGALVLDLGNYLGFLYLLGSFFVPLFGVLLADWLLAGANYTRSDLFRGPAWRVGGTVAWLVGFGTYQWLQPTGPGWWTSIVEHAHPGALHAGASVPSFVVAFVLGAGFGLVASRVDSARASARGRREPLAGPR
ncbi:MAG: cytosine permease [Actinomycetota bacterium]|nr:cytosine permease [Actinomycetota bacterium]